MNTVVDKLLDVDRQARQILDEARAYYEKTAEEIIRERERIRSQYAQKAEAHIADVRASELSAAEEAVARINAENTGRISRMEEIYANGRQEWEDALFDACVKRVSLGG